jgi:hypothetical protein
VQEFGISYLQALIEEVFGIVIPDIITGRASAVVSFFTGTYSCGENDVKYRSPEWYQNNQPYQRNVSPLGVADASQVAIKAPKFYVIIEDGVIKMVTP